MLRVLTPSIVTPSVDYVLLCGSIIIIIIFYENETRASEIQRK